MNLFFFHFDTNQTTVTKSAGQVVLNQKRYATCREQVAEKIADSTNQFLAKNGDLE